MTSVFTRPVGRDAHSSAPRDRAPLAPVVVYGIAAAVGGAIAATLANAAASAAVTASPQGLREVGSVAILAFGVAVVALQVAGGRFHLPQRQRQVPRRWLRGGPTTLVAGRYGLVLGFAAATLLHEPAMYMLAMVAGSAPSVPVAAAVGALWGIGRGVTLVLDWARCGTQNGFLLTSMRSATLGPGLAALASLAFVVDVLPRLSVTIVA
jgi:hypothetical protein